MKKTLLLSAIAALSVAGAASAQQDGEFHLSGGYTFLDADGIEFDAITLRGGYDFTDYLGVEGEVLFGLGDENVGGVDVSVDFGFGAFGKAQYPLSEQFSVFARAGYVYYDAEASAVGVSVSDSEGGLGYGVGAEWAFSGPNAVRFDYTRADLDDADFDAYTLSYVRRF